MVLARDRSQGHELAPLALDDERDACRSPARSSCLGQGERLGDDGIRRVAREEGEQEGCCRSRRGHRPCEPRPRANRNPRHRGEDEARGVDTPRERDLRPASGPEQRGFQLGRRACVHDEPERGHLLREQRCVTRRRAVGDHGTIAGESLEAGDAAGGVHEHVSRGQEVVHRVGEAEHLHARFPGERGLEPHASRRIASGEADHGRVELQRRRHGSREVAYAPAAAGDDDDRPLARQAERAPGLDGRPRRVELRSHQRRHGMRAAEPGDALDARHEALVHHEVQVDALVGPQLEAREVGDRRTRGTSTFPRRRREPRISVAGGQVETTTSGEHRRTSRRTEREPASESAARASHRSTRLRRRLPKSSANSQGAAVSCQR